MFFFCPEVEYIINYNCLFCPEVGNAINHTAFLSWSRIPYKSQCFFSVLKAEVPTGKKRLIWRGRRGMIARCLGEIGGWGWKRSGAETPTGNPSPAPSASAAHASHARHDRSKARSISEGRAKVGGLDSSPHSSRKNAPSRWRVLDVFSFVLARNYNGFLQATVCSLSRRFIKIKVSWISFSCWFILARSNCFLQATVCSLLRQSIKIMVSCISYLSQLQ